MPYYPPPSSGGGSPIGPAGGDLAGTYPDPTLDATISTAVAFSDLADTVISAGKSLTVDTNTLFVDGANHKTIVTGGSGADYAFTVKATSAGNVAAKQYNSSSSGYGGIDIYEANGSTYRVGFGYGNTGTGDKYAGVAYVDTSGVDFKIFTGGVARLTAKVSGGYSLEFLNAAAGGTPVKQYASSSSGFAGTDLYEANGSTFVGAFGYGNSGSGAPYANNVYVIAANKDFVVFGGAGATEKLRVTNAGAVTTNIASFILGSKTTITGGATGNIPTLTAGPVTGNPTKWLPYDDNGTTRYIPSW